MRSNAEDLSPEDLSNFLMLHPSSAQCRDLNNQHPVQDIDGCPLAVLCQPNRARCERGITASLIAPTPLRALSPSHTPPNDCLLR